MKNSKFLVLGVIVASFVLAGCASPSDKIKLTVDNVSWRGDKFLNFDLYLERPDLGISEPIGKSDDLYSSDLSDAINPKLMYVSTTDDEDPESGNMCDRPRFPHRCSVALKGDDANKSSNDFLIKTTFEDGVYLAQKVSVPMPEKLDLPAISEPNSLPEQDEVFDIKFKDVGADKYTVEVNMCNPYVNNGINPCLDGEEYFLQRKDGKLVLAEPDVSSKPMVTEKDGMIEVSSGLKLKFTESVEYYVTAEKTGEVDGVKSFTDITDSKSFPVK
ncbi:hypothetical protein COY05_01845 [Candidatus Peregrinibacteria bacterium CG_4_10_14_0_2_um_filter_38_24]|nr:MAG: hypothetical protein COY05_01845 [Candidatus Peregrinibacteria bacterium CG_4_10_14_0_2_um_filter_38_24]PJC38585.1 MAG: hypothetical protein CO044_04240 [Candidatus Peregrinibacteria bacterium CG_4_9_14_0_2_um_filter_38_9]